MPGGRPIKAGLDFFPLDVALDDKFELIEAKYGIEGFGITIKLFQNIYRNSYFQLITEDWVIVFSNRINVDINLVNDIINDSVKWKLFNEYLYKKYSILTSRGIQKKYAFITKRRKEVEFIAELLLVSNIKSLYSEKVNVIINSINTDINSQRKEKERKGKKRKLKEPQKEPGPEPKKINPKKKDSTGLKSGIINNKKDDKFSFENISGIFQDIKSKCEEIIDLQLTNPKSRLFNPKLWVQLSLKNKMHPGAILKTLDGLLLYWVTTKDPMGYCINNSKIFSGNFNEADAIKIHEKFKEMPKNELSELTSNLFDGIE